MGRLIGDRSSKNYGENLFITKVQEYLDDTNIIYWNRQVFGKEFDVCILMPEKGILVVELKGWREETILRTENHDGVIIRTPDGEVFASPQKQARGYRFAIERHVRQSIGKFPLVFQMVCMPQVSKSYYKSLRLDVIMEERFTILKEDLEDKTAFFHKLDQAFREVNNWNRDPFDKKTLLEVRNLFETSIDDMELEIRDGYSSPYHQHDYSRFYYVSKHDTLCEEVIKDAIAQYLCGCKLYFIVPDYSQIIPVANAIDTVLAQRGLVRNRDDLERTFDECKVSPPKISSKDTSFTCFHCSMSVLNTPFDQGVPSFIVRNGKLNAAQRNLLEQLAKVCDFNAEQYFIEHAAPNKNVVIRAGAGTGKTHTMISRIGFICYTQNVPLRKMAERIVMITFTNEAANQMNEKLKIYFRNCYLLTSNTENLDMISCIDHMQISTIHAYAKQLIAQLGTAFGYGIDVRITSSEFYRRRKISDILDQYIRQKQLIHGSNYTDRLGMPVYAIRNNILEFIDKLHNKNVDVEAIEASDFGTLKPDDPHQELHQLLSTVIPAVEREYLHELLENNRLHLSTMMSILNRFVSLPENRTRICELKKSADALQFMFVDEFQDTDDTQIESLRILAKLLDYRLFLVGDIKQCIYRFRGATENAFDQLKIGEEPEEWLEFSLKQNYRTDSSLLNLFDLSFSNWGARADKLLTYDKSRDCLIGTKDYNSYLLPQKNRFFKKISVANDALRIPALAEEIKRIQRRIQFEEKRQHMRFSDKERSIAILVRENWQAEMIRTECAKLLPNVAIQTNTGGDLYMSQPALDMMVLVNALVHFDEADYLYNLVISNFFNLDIPKSNLFEIRTKIKSGGWRAQADEREQVNYLIGFMNRILVDTLDREDKWEYIVASLRTKPVLQVIRKIYNTLEPWRNYSDDSWKQHYYQLNVDLLYEQLINACDIDRLTINTLQEHLHNCIVSQRPVDSRIPPSPEKDEISVQCITIHKAKGLEYGHVILPFCSASMDVIKKSQLHISAVKSGKKYHIGYQLNIGESAGTIQNSYYDEHTEKSEKSREEARILYVAMTRAIRSFSWIEIQGKQNLSWQNLIETGA